MEDAQTNARSIDIGGGGARHDGVLRPRAQAAAAQHLSVEQMVHAIDLDRVAVSAQEVGRGEGDHGSQQRET